MSSLTRVRVQQRDSRSQQLSTIEQTLQCRVKQCAGSDVNRIYEALQTKRMKCLNIFLRHFEQKYQRINRRWRGELFLHSSVTLRPFDSVAILRAVFVYVKRKHICR